MNNQNSSVNVFYDSDEDVCWGPVTLREVKRDLKRDTKLNPSYRRQTAAFIPLPVEENKKMSSFTSSHSSKDYNTANESLESNNIGTINEMQEKAEKNTSQLDSSICGSDKFQSIENINDGVEVVELSSDSEDEVTDGGLSNNVIELSSSEDEEPHHSENERRDLQLQSSFINFVENVKLENDSLMSKENRISFDHSINEDSQLLSANEEEFDMRQIPTIRIIAKTPIKERKYSSNYSVDEILNSTGRSKISESIEKHNLTDEAIANSPKRMLDFSSDLSKSGNHGPMENFNSVPNNEDEMFENNSEDQLNTTSSDNQDNLIDDDKIQETPTKRLVPKINIISVTPIKRPNYFSMSYSASQNNSLIDGSLQSSRVEKSSAYMSNESDECIEIVDDNSNDSGNMENSYSNDHVVLSSHSSSHKSMNTSQKENEYDYYEEVNHTLSKLASDLSLKNSDEHNHSNLQNSSRTSNILNNSSQSNNIQNSMTPNKFKDSRKTSNIQIDPINLNDLSNSSRSDRTQSMTSNITNDARKSNHKQNVSLNNFNNSNLSDNIENNSTRTSSQHYSTQDDLVSSISDNQTNDSLNDTFAEMERLLTKGFESDSDDSIDNVIDPSPCKPFKTPLGNSTFQNQSRIPVPTSFSDDSKSNASSKSDFKVPKFPVKPIKKTPNKFAASPLPLKNIISPVRVYIKNSPYPTLKHNNKPTSSYSQHILGGLSEGHAMVPKKHKNLFGSLPEVVYKPSKLIKETSDNLIILPDNIRKLITETTVVKHEPRKRINFDESLIPVEQKLNMKDISRIVSDDQNMSVHVKKQGFNL